MDPEIYGEARIHKLARRNTHRHHFVRRPGRKDQQAIMRRFDVDKAIAVTADRKQP